MTLYHYTALHLAAFIQRQGIKPGHLPNKILGGWELIAGYSCLTVNPSFEEQEWAFGGRLPYDRNAARFTLNLPDSRVIDWLEFCQTDILNRETVSILNAYGDIENWKLFKGHIPLHWITAMDEKPSKPCLLVATFDEKCQTSQTNLFATAKTDANK